MRAVTLHASALAVATLVGCGCDTRTPAAGGPPRPASGVEAGAVQEASRPAAIAPTEPEAGSHKIAIPAGPVRAGSSTGTRFRDPSREADGEIVMLSAFAIDARPYPNEPGVSPRTRVDRAEASALCKARGDRLCSELEWERACETSTGAAFPWPGDEPSAACAAAPDACITSEGAVGMGLWGREWTLSAARAGVGDARKTAVVRGKGALGGARPQRCDTRDAATPDSRSDGLTFRCCHGALQDPPYPDETAAAALENGPIRADAARLLLSRMPKTAHLAQAFTPFSEADVQRALASVRAARTSLLPWRPISGQVRWSPVPRERVEIIAGDAPSGAALVVYYPDVDGAPKLITTYETRGEHAPIIVAARPDNPREILFSTCWGCGGEGGALSFGDDAWVRLDLR